jgi:DNA-binding NarL/FixJ family response regulator
MISGIVHSIVLIDDHPLAINGIGTWLSSTGRFTVAGIAGNLAEAESLLKSLNPLPEIIILDVSLGTEDGLKFMPIVKEITAKKNVPCPKVLVCSMYEDPFLIQRAIDSGADAYVAKSEELGEIIKAINAILAGEKYVDAKYHLEIDKNSWKNLTERENEIAFLVKQSLSNRQIAKRLGLSKRTIENHLAHIYDKTGISSRAELFAWKS